MASWAQKDSNLRPSACKADALNQLSYAPFLKGIAKIIFSMSPSIHSCLLLTET